MSEPMEIIDGKSGWVWRCHPCDETSRSTGDEQVARRAMAAHAKTRGHRSRVDDEPIRIVELGVLTANEVADRIAAADRAGFRRAIEALRDEAAYMAFTRAMAMEEFAQMSSLEVVAEYLEHLATKGAADV